MKLNKYIKQLAKSALLLVIMLTAGAAIAQVTVTRTNPPSTMPLCGYVINSYQISVSPNSGVISISDAFTSACGENLIASFTGFPPGTTSGLPSGWTPSTGSGGFNIITNTNNWTGLFTLNVRWSYNEISAANFNSIIYNSAAPLVTATGTSNITITATNADVTLTNNNQWGSRVWCPPMGGYQCFEYEIDLTSRCGFNLTGNGWHRITLPNNAIIQSVLPVNNIGILTTWPISSNDVFVRLQPTSSNTWQINTLYRIKVLVSYPCDDFSAGDNVTLDFSSTWANQLFRPNNCQAPFLSSQQRRGYAIPGSSYSHQIPDTITSAKLTVKREHSIGHDGAGCQNRLLTYLTNKGTMNLKDIYYEMDVPTDITVNCIQDGQFTAYQVGGAWISGNPSATQLAQATKLRWTPTQDQISADRTCELSDPSSNNWATKMCYDIANTATLGQQIDFCVESFYRDTNWCVAPTCDTPTYNWDSTTTCHRFKVTDLLPNPKLVKGVSPSTAYPGDPMAFTVDLKNCGGGNLIGKLTDVIDSRHTITNITYQHINRQVLNSPVFQLGDGGFITATNTSGNNIDLDVDLSGTCKLSQGNCCATEVCNVLRVIIETRVKTCEPAFSKYNVATFSNTDTAINYKRWYSVINRNRLQMTKEAKGDVDPTWSASTTSSPGSNVDFVIKVYNDDPQLWYNPRVADALPDNINRTFCGNTINGQFKIELRGGIAIDYSKVVSGSINSSGTVIKYGSHSVTGDVDFCGGAASMSGTSGLSMGTFKALFDGTLACGDTIIINVPGRIIGGASGDVSTNKAFVISKTSLNTPYTPIYTNSADVKIEDWTPNCCTDDISVYLDPDLSFDEQADYYEVKFPQFDLTRASLIPLQKVKVSVIDFEYRSEYEDCKRCSNPSDYLATIKKASSRIGGLVSNNPVSYNREWNWGLGVPLASRNFDFGLSLLLPKPVNIPCCATCATVCFKVELTDVNCNTCVRYVCHTFNLPEPKVQPNRDACPSANDDTTDPNGGGSIGGTKPWLDDIKEVKDLKIKEGLELKPFCPTCPR